MLGSLQIGPCFRTQPTLTIDGASAELVNAVSHHVTGNGHSDNLVCGMQRKCLDAGKHAVDISRALPNSECRTSLDCPLHW